MPQNTTTNTHREPTTTLPSTGFVLSPWQHQPRTQLFVPPIPISPGKACGVGLALSTTGSLVWGAKERPIIKKRDGWGLDLRWPQFDGKQQQSTTSWHPWWEGCRRGGARGWESVWGDTVPCFGATIQTMKKNIYEIHHCLWMAPNRQRLTQQPTNNRRPQQREVWRGGATIGRRVGNMIPLLWQKLSNKEKEKEIHHGLKRHRPINFHTTTNQK